jgi:hypothetical protein
VLGGGFIASTVAAWKTATTDAGVAMAAVR